MYVALGRHLLIHVFMFIYIYIATGRHLLIQAFILILELDRDM